MADIGFRLGLSCSHWGWVRCDISVLAFLPYLSRYSVVRLVTNYPVDSCFHASRLLSDCTAGHTARLPPLSLRLSVGCLLRSLSIVFALS